MTTRVTNYSFNYNKKFYDSLKVAENDYKIPLRRNRFNIIRLDGASFSKQFKLRYEKFSKKIPYNPYLAYAMQATVMDAMREFPFISFAYSFSDEVSFLVDNALIDFRKMNSLEKMISILSSFVSSAFNMNLNAIVNLNVSQMINESGQIDADRLAKYSQFIKNAMYLLNVAKRNQIPLMKSGKEKNDSIEGLYLYSRYEMDKKPRREKIQKIVEMIKAEMPFDDYENHIFYFDARLVSFESESKAYEYFKARQGFAVYKFVEDLAFSIIEKPIVNNSNKTTNMYFKQMNQNKVPISVYTNFDESLRLGISFYKVNNFITKQSAKELKKEFDDSLISIISNVVDDHNVVAQKQKEKFKAKKAK